MNHTLRLQIPEKLYEPLVKVAAQMGRTPEELAVDWLAAAMQEYVDDPLEKFIGAFSSNIPDWADQHDRYIGQSLINTKNTEENSDRQKLHAFHSKIFNEDSAT